MKIQNWVKMLCGNILLLGLSCCQASGTDELGFPNVERRGIRWSAMYQPTDKVVQTATGQVANDSLRKLYDHFLYFRLAAAAPQKGGVRRQLGMEPSAFTDLLRYYELEMSSDLRLICGRDTLRCGMHHLEQNGLLEHQLNFLLGFENPRRWHKIPQKAVLEYVHTPFPKDTMRFFFSESQLQP